MEFTDEELTCIDCGEKFTFTAGEQEFYQSKGLDHKPKRCKECRDKKKQQRESFKNSNDHQER